MKILKPILSSLFVFFGCYLSAQIECPVDVVIAEGASISMCENALETLNASSGYVSYDWTGPETVSGATITPNFSGLYTVEATDGGGCVSHADILVTINPAPVDAIASSEGDTLCPGVANTTLSLSNPYILYDWGGGNNLSILQVTEGGDYSVDVADANGCVATFTYTITTLDFDLTQNASAGCTGASVALSASGGENSTFLWSTGEIGQTIVVNPSSTTNYSVQITDGDCMQQLSTSVTVGELPDFNLPDTIYVADSETAFINGPSDFLTYSWTPENLVDNPSGASVNFIGSESAVISLEATHPDGCVLRDSVVVIVVRVNIPNGFSPNSDGINDTFVVPEMFEMDGALTVWNRWGDKVYEASHYNNDWDGTCQGTFCLGNDDLPEGTYFYLIDIQEITFKGYITLKR